MDSEEEQDDLFGNAFSIVSEVIEKIKKSLPEGSTDGLPNADLLFQVRIIKLLFTFIIYYEHCIQTTKYIVIE